MANIKQLSDGGPDGTKLGQSDTDLVGFYGVTAVVQPSSASQAAVTTAASTAITLAFGYATSTQADGIVTLVNQLRSDLVTLGLIKGSA